MDTTDPLIQFDASGVCNHCHSYDEAMKNWPLQQWIAENKLKNTFDDLKEKTHGNEYNCLMGLSGGVDSSYVALLAHEHGLKPLCVHLDNGWNTELAVSNINNIVKRLNFDLYTHVIDWTEFRDLQRSFFAADVVDIEVLSDHAIFGVILQLARKHKIKYILSGANIATEQVMPKSWVHRKQDLTNIQDIQRKFGTKALKSFPQVSTLEHVISMYAFGYKVLKPLNMIDYNKDEAKKRLINELGWRDYGGKHYESLFTKFYQAYILPTKFKIDKRKAHLSTLILSGQITREQALEELQKPLYLTQQLEEDTTYFCKKLGFTKEEFQQYLQRPPVPHLHYKSDEKIYQFLNWVRGLIGH